MILDVPVKKDVIQNELKPHRDEYRPIPKKQDAEFVAHMEDVLDVYSRPYDPQKPLICLDEKPYMIHPKKIQLLILKNAIEIKRYFN
ncbi:hypothetical protein ABNN70_06520 [Sporolactobacillus sp. Y61]|uniref:Transposase n=1 Tax=Sporolactobacillus sp. Y61 TaxID=3160863 RepID=A0AAU8IJA8_9BACL